MESVKGIAAKRRTRAQEDKRAARVKIFLQSANKNVCIIAVGILNER
jgi:hypothetical protein